ncbi:hypothetical protein DsansV1_C03g0028741 [Dioscorea sansibarensis]
MVYLIKIVLWGRDNTSSTHYWLSNKCSNCIRSLFQNKVLQVRCQPARKLFLRFSWKSSCNP